MTNPNCLDCGNELTGKYCSECGQKADTHRITFQHFIFHDVLHGTFHLERGILFTAKQALIRPGKAALEYIAGKRKRYYNVFYLILITLGLLLFLRHFFDELSTTIIYPDDKAQANQALDQIYSQKAKLLIFLFVPFGALNSFILYRRKKLNLSEHAIVAGMILLGMLLISLIGHALFYLDFIIPFSDGFADLLSYLVTYLIIFYVVYGYINAFGKDYSKLAMAYKTVLFFGLLWLEAILLFVILIGFATDWKFAGTFNLNPFQS